MSLKKNKIQIGDTFYFIDISNNCITKNTIINIYFENRDNYIYDTMVSVERVYPNGEKESKIYTHTKLDVLGKYETEEEVIKKFKNFPFINIDNFKTFNDGLKENK